jgi:predicted nucleic acid-binding protein
VILVDTSVWVDHLRRGDSDLAALLDDGRVLMHPFVIGEVACGSLSERAEMIGLMMNMPAAALAEHDEVLTFVEQHRLHGQGIGFVDAHLLTSVALMPGTLLWARDRRLLRTATSLGCAFEPRGPG